MIRAGFVWFATVRSLQRADGPATMSHDDTMATMKTLNQTIVLFVRASLEAREHGSSLTVEGAD